MRTMITVQLPAAAGNKAMLDGSLAKVIGQFIERNKPEACFFTTSGGKRTGYFVIDLKTSSDMPVVGEAFFLQLDADVTFQPVMTIDELKDGLSRLPK